MKIRYFFLSNLNIYSNSKETFTEHSLLQSSKNLGRGKETTKEKLRNALNQQRAGITVDDGVEYKLTRIS